MCDYAEYDEIIDQVPQNIQDLLLKIKSSSDNAECEKEFLQEKHKEFMLRCNEDELSDDCFEREYAEIKRLNGAAMRAAEERIETVEAAQSLLQRFLQRLDEDIANVTEEEKLAQRHEKVRKHQRKDETKKPQQRKLKKSGQIPSNMKKMKKQPCAEQDKAHDSSILSDLSLTVVEESSADDSQRKNATVEPKVAQQKSQRVGQKENLRKEPSEEMDSPIKEPKVARTQSKRIGKMQTRRNKPSEEMDFEIEEPKVAQSKSKRGSKMRNTKKPTEEIEQVDDPHSSIRSDFSGTPVSERFIEKSEQRDERVEHELPQQISKRGGKMGGKMKNIKREPSEEMDLGVEEPKPAQTKSKRGGKMQNIKRESNEEMDLAIEKPKVAQTKSKRGGKMNKKRKPTVKKYKARRRLFSAQSDFSSSSFEDSDEMDDVPCTSAQARARTRSKYYPATKYFTRAKNSLARSSNKDSTCLRSSETRQAERKFYCICNKRSYGKMIACDNNACPYGWFHYECVKIVVAPAGSWYCPECRVGVRERRRAAKRNI